MQIPGFRLFLPTASGGPTGTAKAGANGRSSIWMLPTQTILFTSDSAAKGEG